MKVRIISYESLNSWILGKFARKLHEELEQFGVSSEIGSEPDPSADINHHIIYNGYDPTRAVSNDTLMITHIDDLRKFNLLKDQMNHASVGICMSRDTMVQLIGMGIPAEKTCYVSPARDVNIPPKKWVIGITSRIYPDGCKREDLLVKLCATIPADLFEFRIMGSGWEEVIRRIHSHNIEVTYYPDFDQRIYVELIRSLDYYLYLGMDEGSMGFLDALAAGVKTIVTSQGYHLDAENGITHPFRELDELVLIFQEIANERMKLIQSVSDWTWKAYAAKHLEIWKYLVAGTVAGNMHEQQYGDGLRSLLHKDGLATGATEMSKTRLLMSSWRKRMKKIQSLSELKKTINRTFKGR